MSVYGSRERERVHYSDVGMAWWQEQEAKGSHFIGNRKQKETTGVGARLETLKDYPQCCTSFSKAPPLKDSITSQNSATS